MEIFCYPYSGFDKVYIRLGRRTQAISKYELPKFMLAYNQSRWFMNHGSDVVKHNIDSDSPLAQEIQMAYNAGIEKDLKEQTEIRIREREAMLQRIINMKPVFREGFLNEDPLLRKMYDDYLSNGGDV
jgi:hypothetical protein